MQFLFFFLSIPVWPKVKLDPTSNLEANLEFNYRTPFLKWKMLKYKTGLTITTCFLQAYDTHLNMILGDVEETVTTIEIDEETYEEVYRSTKRTIPMLYVRGDSVILVSPPSRSTN